MRIGSFVLLLAAAPLVALAQSQAPLPPDINPVTLSRLPPVTPEDLDDEAPKAYKNIDQVMAQQEDLVEIVAELKQVVCVKG